MASGDDIRAHLDEAATAPKKASGDEGSVEMHGLPDLIEADRYARARDKPSAPAGGLMFTKLVPPGTA